MNMHSLLTGRLRESGQRLQLLLEDAFRKKARITLENINTAEEMRLYLPNQLHLTEVPRTRPTSRAVPPLQPDPGVAAHAD